ncbi:molybdopterin converting factor subunit 1 [methanotrophic bacterial endosymbiont of Bathymodiolus sp.]|jgi:molybdopterin synthase sulfur carrier subunit|nr:molybdopterin converting factor subunit 1 [methanotrophic bacterial endosymbiont of Bathymodiolus sp.]
MAVAIKVRYFASLKENLGRESDSLEVEKAISVIDVWAKAARSEPMPENTLAAVNMEYVGLDHQVLDGDEVAFFPPVTGG